MPICKKCDNQFPNKIWLDGKYKHLHRRSYCLECSPIGQRIRSGPLPKDGSDPFVASTPENTYPNGDRRPIVRQVICDSCLKPFTKKHNNLTCNTCKSRIARNKIRNDLKILHGGKCQLCEYDKLEVLTFHHVDPNTKDFNLSALYGSKNKELLQKEAEKCILLCPNCHAEVHQGLTEFIVLGR